jgi:hypothetical protein
MHSSWHPSTDQKTDERASLKGISRQVRFARCYRAFARTALPDSGTLVINERRDSKCG